MGLNKPTRYFLLVLGLILALHFLLSATHEPYSNATSFSSLTAGWRKEKLKYTDTAVPAQPDIQPLPKWNTGVTGAANVTRANATFVMLARNSDVNGAVQSIRSLEDRFNREYGYPYVFLNEEPWTDEFKKCVVITFFSCSPADRARPRRISVLTHAPIEWGVIPHDWWFQPDWIDEEKATESRKKMEEQGIIYAGSVSYRNMCRFNSGFFFKHELLLKYKWYWRIE
jgi:alpha 1,2-mannosyltransferase